MFLEKVRQGVDKDLCFTFPQNRFSVPLCLALSLLFQQGHVCTVVATEVILKALRTYSKSEKVTYKYFLYNDV